jgi:pimeloyl-ACP methyl ester carboxylesterase
LFLLPGLLCDRLIWSQQLPALMDAGWTVEVADFRGFSSITAMAESVLAKAPPRFSLAGHSMGARVAIETLRLQPQRIARLALLDTGTHPRRPGEAEKRQVLVDLARNEGMAAAAAQWLPPMVHPDRIADESLMGPLREMVGRMTPAIFEGQIQALLDRPDAESVLGTIRCPVLIGVGRQDAWSPVSQHEAMAAAIPGAELVVFENAGHMAPLEAPAAVTAAMLRWLAAPVA